MVVQHEKNGITVFECLFVFCSFWILAFGKINQTSSSFYEHANFLRIIHLVTEYDQNLLKLSIAVWNRALVKHVYISLKAFSQPP